MNQIVSCDLCGKEFESRYRVRIGGAYENGSLGPGTCPDCTREELADILEYPSCPECGAEPIEYRYYDYGTDPETGYSDSGTYALCRSCGYRGEDTEFEPRERNLALASKLREPNDD